MDLTGSLFINQCVALLTFIIVIILKICVIKFKDFYLCRKLGMKLPNNMILAIILRLYIDGYIGILIGSLINIESYQKSSDPMTLGDVFSFVFCIGSTVILILLPLSILTIAYIYKDYIKDREKMGKYNILFTDLNRDTFAQTIYHAIFFIKRIFICVVLVHLRQIPNV